MNKILLSTSLAAAFAFSSCGEAPGIHENTNSLPQVVEADAVDAQVEQVASRRVVGPLEQAQVEQASEQVVNLSDISVQFVPGEDCQEATLDFSPYGNESNGNIFSGSDLILSSTISPAYPVGHDEPPDSERRQWITIDMPNASDILNVKMPQDGEHNAFVEIINTDTGKSKTLYNTVPNPNREADPTIVLERCDEAYGGMTPDELLPNLIFDPAENDERTSQADRISIPPYNEPIVEPIIGEADNGPGEVEAEDSVIIGGVKAVDDINGDGSYIEFIPTLGEPIQIFDPAAANINDEILSFENDTPTDDLPPLVEPEPEPEETFEVVRGSDDGSDDVLAEPAEPELVKVTGNDDGTPFEIEPEQTIGDAASSDEILGIGYGIDRVDGGEIIFIPVET